MGKKIRISRGEGYGGRPFHEGQVLRHPKHGILFVVSASKRYFREDGLSFGVGDDSGYIFGAVCRQATEAEAQAVLEREDKAQKIAAAKARLKEIRKHIMETGERPTTTQPSGEVLMSTQTIYGGGDWWVISRDGIWYCRNNGGDGDDWANNNVLTGGAGAIGWRVPFDQALADEICAIDALHKKEES